MSWKEKIEQAQEGKMVDGHQGQSWLSTWLDLELNKRQSSGQVWERISGKDSLNGEALPPEAPRYQDVGVEYKGGEAAA